jgi:hypothetical protein
MIRSLSQVPSGREEIHDSVRGLAPSENRTEPGTLSNNGGVEFAS